MNAIFGFLIDVICKLAETSLHCTSVRGNFQKDLRQLKATYYGGTQNE